MKEILKSAIQFLVFATIGIFLFWLVYKDQPIAEIVEALKNADYFYIVISFFIAALSHLSRAMRWKLLIQSTGYNPSTTNTFLAVMAMYLSNTAIPRSGEIVRCGLMNKYEKIPIPFLLGTVFIERTIDFIMLFILLLIVIFTQFNVLQKFTIDNPKLDFNFDSFTLFLLLVSFIAFLVILYLNRKKIANSFLFRKIKPILINFWDGIRAIKRLEKKWQFIFHSIFIWSMYFTMIYIVFLSFEFTSHLSILAGLTVFVMASFGMVAPSPGGIGTWHFMVIETLAIFGIQKIPDANAFAFACHGSMTLFIIFLGLISVIILPVYNKKLKKIAH